MIFRRGNLELYSNNFGGASSEYSIGVKHPEINNGQMTHIPSIYGGRIRSEKYAIDQIIKNKGKDPETGRFITPGGDPNARSKGITYSQAPLASKPNNETGFNYQAPAYGTDKPQGVRGGQPTVVRQPNGNQAVNYQTASFQPEQMAPQPLQEPAYGRSGGIYSPQQMAEMVAYSQKLAKAQGLGLGTKI